jgi:hypothetical protein
MELLVDLHTNVDSNVGSLSVDSIEEVDKTCGNVRQVSTVFWMKSSPLSSMIKTNCIPDFTSSRFFLVLLLVL